jgi:hypothetical protein
MNHGQVIQVEKGQKIRPPIPMKTNRLKTH